MDSRPIRRPVSGVRGRVRLRYDRLVAAGSALAVTLVALLGGIGVLADSSSAAAASPHKPVPVGPGPVAGLAAKIVPPVATLVPPPATHSPSAQTPSAQTSPAQTSSEKTSSETGPVPAHSGTGRRVVFDLSGQRVWLVAPGAAGEEKVLSTYLVSGSLTANLSVGTYAVYSRSRRALGIDDSGVMQYFVRFTRGDRAAIGFHSIPTKDGRPLQSTAQLGTPQSHGCIRQALADARRLWDFAPVGTKVVVTA